MASPSQPLVGPPLASQNSPSSAVDPEPMPPTRPFRANSAAYVTSGNACLDFFFKIGQGVPSSTVASLLASAWEQDPLTALKLVCHLRAVRGTGKSDKEGFYSAALWIHSHHPKTLALNADSFAEFGYLKDLLEILYRLINGPDARENAKRNRLQMSTVCHGRRRMKRKTKKGGKNGITEEKVASKLAKTKIDVESMLRNRRLNKRTRMATRAAERQAGDSDYCFLHERIAELFAALLASDLEKLRTGKINEIGLAAKWCPSLGSSFDRVTLICDSIARRLFLRDSTPEYAGIEERHYVYRVRDRLRKEVLVPLRKVLELPETYMSSRQWDSLPYNSVSSVAMKRYKDVFGKHDRDRFAEYLGKVKEQKAKIAVEALLPHEIFALALCEGAAGVSDLQWRRLVDHLQQKGKLSNCIAVCGLSHWSTSYGMTNECLALGMLVSELSEEPWKGRVIEVNMEAKMHRIEGETLREKAEFLKQMNVLGEADLQNVFEMILNVAVEGNLPPEKMIKRVFFFSGFDKVGNETETETHLETDYGMICRKFEEKGYGSVVPEIVFWNLGNCNSVPVVWNQKGVALVSGISKNLVKLFLDGDGVVNPEAVMEAAIAGMEYQNLAVFD